MIRVRKPDLAPEILRDRGAALTEELCDRVDAGERPSFERDVYGAAEVKEALCTAQHDKCCFCESKLGHAQFGDVEHFRPKASAQQGPTDSPMTGYYWLAYAWKNLYLSCAICNQRHKRCMFPLANPDRRVSSHHRSADLDAEQPLFVDPGNEDPTAFIEYRREYAAAVAGNARGSATLEVLQLNRPPLVERRRDRRELLRVCLLLLAKAIASELSEDGDREVMEMLSVIADAATDRSEYSSMVRSLLRQAAPWRGTGRPGDARCSTRCEPTPPAGSCFEPSARRADQGWGTVSDTSFVAISVFDVRTTLSARVYSRARSIFHSGL